MHIISCIILLYYNIILFVIEFFFYIYLFLLENTARSCNGIWDCTQSTCIIWGNKNVSHITTFPSGISDQCINDWNNVLFKMLNGKNISWIVIGSIWLISISSFLCCCICLFIAWCTTQIKKHWVRACYFHLYSFLITKCTILVTIVLYMIFITQTQSQYAETTNASPATIVALSFWFLIQCYDIILSISEIIYYKKRILIL